MAGARRLPCAPVPHLEDSTSRAAGRGAPTPATVDGARVGSGARSDRLGDVTASAAGTSGDRVAVVSGVRTCTYAALDDRVRRLAGALADGVVAPGARVATLLHNRVEVIESLYGVPSAGAVL